MLTQLIAGDSLTFTRSVPDYPASAGYTLSYRLVPISGAGTAITFNATASGADYAVSVAPATTAAWAVGEYSWAAYVSKAGERRTVDSGTLKVAPDVGAVNAPWDARSFARQALDAIEAAILQRASSTQLEVAVFGRTVKSMSHAELLAARSRLAREVEAEQAASDLANGVKRKNRVLVRFGGA